MARPVGDGRRLTGQLEGTVAIVTGAAHGLGRAIGTELAAAGATVAACDILAAELEDTRGLVAARGRTSRFAVVDVTDARQVAAFVADVSRTEGRLDILVNNAGGVAGQTGRPIDEISDQDWHQLFAINLDATFHFTRAVVPHMKARAGGSIVNISAGAGRADSLTGIQAYASAKAGVIGFTRQMARELGPYGIRVNSVAPGFLRTTPVTERQWAAMGETGQRDFLDSIALRRLGRPEDIAKAVVFFASDDAAYVTGQTLGVDGGRQMFW